MSGASTSFARGLSGGKLGFMIPALTIWLVVFTNSRPLSGSKAPPPQLAPPITPGRITVPCNDGGV